MKLPMLRELAKLLVELSGPPDTKTLAPKKHRALIIEDDRDDAYMLMHFLRSERWDYQWARSPREAQDLFDASLTFDIIFMDIVFPGDRDGYSYSHSLANSAKTENIPVVFVTGAPDTLVRTKAGDYLAHIVKPVNLESVRRALKSSLVNGLNLNVPKPRVIISTSFGLMIACAIIGNGIGSGNGWLVRALASLFKAIQ